MIVDLAALQTLSIANAISFAFSFSFVNSSTV